MLNRSLKKDKTKINSEEDLARLIDWQKVNFLIPVIVQDYLTGEVLMLGYMNEEALRKSLQEGKITYYSRTRKGPWTKGDTSGNFQYIKGVWLDCDNDSLLIKVKQVGQVCHTGRKTCFYKKYTNKKYAP